MDRPHMGLIGVVALVLGLPLAAAAVEPVSDPGFPRSAGVQLKDSNFNPTTLNAVADMGFGVIRKGVYWSSVEKTKGAYSFSNYDALFAQADALGLTIVATLYGGNTLYNDQVPNANGITTEEGRQGFANFAAAVAERYKDYDIIWEVWNEPNTRSFWGTHGNHNTQQFAGEYTSLVQAIMPKVLAKDPDAFVVAGAVSAYWQPSYNWTEYCFQNGILETGIKGWSVHPYGVGRPEDFAVGHAAMKSRLATYGHADMPLLNSERGFALGEGGGPTAMHETYQAWHLVRQYMVDQLHGVPLTVWYEWSGEAEFALYKSGQPTLAADAAEVMLEQMDGYRFLSRIETDSDLDYLLLFRNGDGDAKLVAWTAPPPGGSPDDAELHTVTIEIDGTTPLELVSLYGDIQFVQPLNGELSLLLSGAPQYLTLPDGYIPEPTSLGLIGVGGLVLMKRRRLDAVSTA